MDYKCSKCGYVSSDGSYNEKEISHCPNCLCAVHEIEDEDDCGGTLEPVSVWVKGDGDWELISRCRLCGEMLSSPLQKWDNKLKVLSVALKPLASPPFPIEKMEELSKFIESDGDEGTGL